MKAELFGLGLVVLFSRSIHKDLHEWDTIVDMLQVGHIEKEGCALSLRQAIKRNLQFV